MITVQSSSVVIMPARRSSQSSACAPAAMPAAPATSSPRLYGKPGAQQRHRNPGQSGYDMGGRAQHRSDQGQERHRHDEIQRPALRDLPPRQGTDHGEDIPNRRRSARPRRRNRRASGAGASAAPARTSRRPGVGLVNQQIGGHRPLAERRRAQVRRDRGRIHRHAQIHGQRGGQDDQRRHILYHERQGGELCRTRHHDDRKNQRLEHVQPGFGGQNAEQKRERAHDHEERRAVAKPGPECGFGGGERHVLPLVSGEVQIAKPYRAVGGDAIGRAGRHHTLHHRAGPGPRRT